MPAIDSRLPFEVLWEDNHLLVVNKSAGIATMGIAGSQDRAAASNAAGFRQPQQKHVEEEVSLVDCAADYVKRKYRKPGNVFIGVVQRLDKPVSGVLVLARTSKAASRLSKQVRERTIEKRYLAWVEGLPANPAGNQ